MKTVTDPLDLYETFYWCFVAGQSNRRAQGNDRRAMVNDALEKLYKKLEVNKVFITILKKKNDTRTNE